MRVFTVLAFGLLSFSSIAGTLSGRVVATTDGGTLIVLDAHNKRHKVRIAGIEAPETTQPYGDRSKQHLADLVLDKSVSVEWQQFDTYGRVFGKVMLARMNACPAAQLDCPKTIDVGMAQIVAGFAWQYRHFENEQTPQDRAAYSFGERVARAKRAGLWADTGPVPPWQWRSEHKLQ
jgi:endonuclease YncB( thermonuclease family)